MMNEILSYFKVLKKGDKQMEDFQSSVKLAGLSILFVLGENINTL